MPVCRPAASKAIVVVLFRASTIVVARLMRRRVLWWCAQGASVTVCWFPPVVAVYRIMG